MRLLIVDDAETDLESCRSTKERWNRTHIGDSVISELVERKTYSEARAYFSRNETCAIDGIILDLKLAEQADAGQLLIDELNAMHRRIPIVVFTATPDSLSFQYLLGTFKKGTSQYDAAFERFEIAQKVGLMKILGCDGLIELRLKEIFDKAIVSRLDSWKKYVDAVGSENAERALSRSVVEHLHEALDGNSDEYAPDEFYVTDLSNQQSFVRSGEILTSRNTADKKYFVVISPACDLALHGDPCKPKSDVVQVCELEPVSALFKSVGGCVSKRIGKESKKAGDDLKTRQEKVDAAILSFHNQVLENRYATYYHYFPAAVGFDGLIMNFRHLKMHSHAEVTTEYTKTGYIVSPNFFRDIQSRFAAYYGRQGQPEICKV